MKPVFCLFAGEPHKPVILSPEASVRKDSYRLRWSVKSPYKILQQKVNYWEKGPTKAVAKASTSAHSLFS